MNNKRNKYYSFSRAMLVFIVCTVLALFFFGQQYFWAYSFDKQFNFLSDLSYQLVYFYAWGILFIFLVRLADKFRFEWGKWLKSISIHIVAGIAAAFFHRAFTLTIYTMIFHYEKYQAGFPEGLTSKIILGSFDSFVAYWFIIGAYYGYDYYKQYSTTKLKESELEKQLAQAELHALKMQIHPHFLFNAMHTVSALMDEDIKAARSTMTKLSDLLRKTLDNSGIEEIPFKEELDFLQNYLEIEQIRFQDKLLIEFKIDPITMNAMVPNLILQPLAENAVKHGIAKLTSGGKIEIQAFKENDTLQLLIKDNGINNDNENIKEGIGLTNIRKRLQHLYSESASMKVRKNLEDGFNVTISIPFKSSFDAAANEPEDE